MVHVALWQRILFCFSSLWILLLSLLLPPLIGMRLCSSSRPLFHLRRSFFSFEVFLFLRFVAIRYVFLMCTRERKRGRLRGRSFHVSETIIVIVIKDVSEFRSLLFAFVCIPFADVFFCSCNLQCVMFENWISFLLCIGKIDKENRCGREKIVSVLRFLFFLRFFCSDWNINIVSSEILDSLIKSVFRAEFQRNWH